MYTLPHPHAYGKRFLSENMRAARGSGVHEMEDVQKHRKDDE